MTCNRISFLMGMKSHFNIGLYRLWITVSVDFIDLMTCVQFIYFNETWNQPRTKLNTASIYTCKLPLQCQFLRDFLRFTFPRNILIFSLFDSFIFLPFRSYQLILLGFVLLSEVAFRRWQSILSSICTFSDDLAKKAMLFHILWRWNVDKTWFESKTN